MAGVQKPLRGHACRQSSPPSCRPAPPWPGELPASSGPASPTTCPWPLPSHVPVRPRQEPRSQGPREAGGVAGLVGGEPEGRGSSLRIPDRLRCSQPGGLALTRFPLDEPGWQSGGSWASPLGALLVPVLPPVPQLGVDEPPHEPGLGSAHQQQHAQPVGGARAGSGVRAPAGVGVQTGRHGRSGAPQPPRGTPQRRPPGERVSVLASPLAHCRGADRGTGRERPGKRR